MNRNKHTTKWRMTKWKLLSCWTWFHSSLPNSMNDCSWYKSGSSKPFPWEGQESSFSEVSIDRIVCNGPLLCLIHVCLIVVPVPCWETDRYRAHYGWMATFDRWPEGLNTDQPSIHVSAHIHTRTQRSIISFIIYYKAETNPRWRREIMIQRPRLHLQVNV